MTSAPTRSGIGVTRQKASVYLSAKDRSLGGAADGSEASVTLSRMHGPAAVAHPMGYGDRRGNGQGRPVAAAYSDGTRTVGV
jgi:hypothetical protein